MTRAVLLGLLLLTTLVYSPVLSADFVYEDRVSADDIWPAAGPLDPTGPWETISIPARPRSLANLTFALQGRHGDSPMAYHVVNLLIHEVNGLLLYAVLLPAGAGAAIGMTALWLLHPIHAEAVSYVSARPDLLMATALLLLLLTTRQSSWRAVGAATTCGLFAVLAKETGVVVVALLPLWLTYRGRWSRRWMVPLAIWGLGGVWVAYRLFHVSALQGAPPWSALSAYTPAAARTGLAYVAWQSAALWRLLALLVVPVGFTVDHDFDLVPVWLTAAALIALLTVLVLAWRGRHRQPSLWCAVAWMGLCLAPRFLIPLPDAINEHQLYVPLLGLALTGWAGLSALADGRRLWEESSPMADFNVCSPPLSITNPEAVKAPPSPDYPRHLHRYGKPPVVVWSDEEKAEKLAAGYALQPVLEKPKPSRD